MYFNLFTCICWSCKYQYISASQNQSLANCYSASGVSVSNGSSLAQYGIQGLQSGMAAQLYEIPQHKTSNNKVKNYSHRRRNHVSTVYIRYFWQGKHQLYGANIRSWPTLCIDVAKRNPWYGCSTYQGVVTNVMSRGRVFASSSFLQV